MRSPPGLNPLQDTPFAWVPPLVWALIKAAVAAAPVTLEVFLHHRFGVRSGKALIKGFLLLLIVFGTIGPLGTLLSGLYFVAYAMMAVVRWPTGRLDAYEGVHSYSTGEPHPAWRRFTHSIPVIRCVLEPLFCGLVALIISDVDVVLACWLGLATVALFVREVTRYAHLREHRLDALDHRIEAQELAPPRVQAHDEPFVEARPAPPRAHLQARPGRLPPHR